MQIDKSFNFPRLNRVPQTHGVHVATLHLRAYFAYHVELASTFAQHAAANLNMPTAGTVPLPKTKELVTVLKSPFVHKKSMENFTRYTHKRTIKIYDTNKEVLDLFLRYIKRNAVVGVGMKCYIYEYEQFGFGSKDIAALESAKDAVYKAQAVSRVKHIVKELSGPSYTGPEAVPPPSKEVAEQAGEAASEGAEVAATAEATEAPKEETKEEAPAPKEDAQDTKPEADSAPKQ